MRWVAPAFRQHGSAPAPHARDRRAADHLASARAGVPHHRPERRWVSRRSARDARRGEPEAPCPVPSGSPGRSPVDGRRDSACGAAAHLGQASAAPGPARGHLTTGGAPPRGASRTARCVSLTGHPSAAHARPRGPTWSPRQRSEHKWFPGSLTPRRCGGAGRGDRALRAVAPRCVPTAEAYTCPRLDAVLQGRLRGCDPGVSPGRSRSTRRSATPTTTSALLPDRPRPAQGRGAVAPEGDGRAALTRPRHYPHVNLARVCVEAPSARRRDRPASRRARHRAAVPAGPYRAAPASRAAQLNPEAAARRPRNRSPEGICGPLPYPAQAAPAG